VQGHLLSKGRLYLNFLSNASLTLSWFTVRAIILTFLYNTHLSSLGRGKNSNPEQEVADGVTEQSKLPRVRDACVLWLR